MFKWTQLDLASRARCVLLWCAVTLCISPMVGGWLVDHCPLHIRNPEVATTVSLWKKANPRPDILLLGSSRLGYFVRTDELAALTKEKHSGNIFNASLLAGEPIAIEFLTRLLLASENGIPRLAILETSPDLLMRNNVYFEFVITRQLTETDLPKYMREILLSHTSISRLLSSRLIPFFRHRHELLKWAAETARYRSELETLQIDGSQSAGRYGNSFQGDRDRSERSTVPMAERISTGTHRFESHLRNYQIAGGTSAAFESTVAMLQARGCFIVLLEPPLPSAQRALFTTEIQRQFNAFLQRLQNVYGCEFVDYSDRLPDTLFVDNHHAGNAGSLAFTELLAREIVIPMWRNLDKEEPHQ